MNMADPKRVSTAAMAALDRLQAYRPEEQVMGLNALFVLLAKEYGVQVQDVSSATSNLMFGPEGMRPAFRGFVNYLKNEVVK